MGFYRKPNVERFVRYGLDFNKLLYYRLLWWNKKNWYEIPLKYPYITIGSNGDVSIKDDSLDSIHARIYASSGVLFIEDSDSLNGIYINGIKVKNKTRPLSGFVIEMGNQRFRVEQHINPFELKGLLYTDFIDYATFVNDIKMLATIDYLKTAINYCNGDMIKLMRLSGISKTVLYRMIDNFGLQELSKNARQNAPKTSPKPRKLIDYKMKDFIKKLKK